MPLPENEGRVRFEGFELDLQTLELRKNGRPIKLQDKPGKLLALLACRAGELVTRAEIEKALWREDEFVEFEHAVNTAMRKVREALGDSLESPRFVETLPRKGYRFVAAVQIDDLPGKQTDGDEAPPSISPTTKTEFGLPRQLARVLLLIVQGGYLAMYCIALYEAEAIEGVLARILAASAAVFAPLLLVTAMCGIAVRLYLIASVGFDHPAAGEKYRRLFPALFILDLLWAVSPLLLMPKIGFGLALGSIAALVYLPFSQRTLVRSIYRPSAVESTGDPRERV
jgi:cholera toxin transcriptional activator